MAQIAGLRDFRGDGNPADIGVFQTSAQIIVFRHIFSGVTYYVAMRTGVRGWMPVNNGVQIDPTLAIEAAWTELGALGGGTVVTKGPGETWVLQTQLNSQGATVTWMSDKSLTLQARANLDINVVVITHSRVTLVSVKVDANKANQTAGADLSAIQFADGADWGLAYGCEGYNAQRQTAIGGDGIEVMAGADHVIVNMCFVHDNDYDGIKLRGTYYSIATDNTCLDNGAGGVQGTDSAYSCVIANNTIRGNRVVGPTATWTRGITLHYFYLGVVTGNTISNVHRGILLAEHVSGTTITSNTIEDSEYGIATYLSEVNNNLIQSNIIWDSDTYGIFIAAGFRYNSILDNYIYDAPTGIHLNAADAVSTWIRGNKFRGCTDKVIDNGTDTIFPVVLFQFTHASAAGSVSLTSPIGILVDGAGDEALLWGHIPAEVQGIMRIEVWAVAKGAPEAAGGQMHAEFTFNAGGSLEAYDLVANSWNIVNKDSVEADYANGVVIHWLIDNIATGWKMQNLTVGDDFEFILLYEGEVSPDGATNAVIRSAEFYHL